MTRRIRLPTLDETERQTKTEREAPPDAVGYWTTRERWEKVGRELGRLRQAARERGVPVESMPRAAFLAAELRMLGKALDRGAR